MHKYEGSEVLHDSSALETRWDFEIFLFFYSFSLNCVLILLCASTPVFFELFPLFFPSAPLEFSRNSTGSFDLLKLSIWSGIEVSLSVALAILEMNSPKFFSIMNSHLRAGICTWHRSH